ncbi:conserved Plasmodium protein, unknown function [Plasmodium knowlesi strain H]|uniref:Eukaryotic translation initiation factor 4E n=3 Tax=Plasmodium knowlesi TaxID=5850 RepID=A0A5K1UKM9_PLAKH|nr:eukaryotic translation initiation factor 4E, putative [Plasmodium knowlesi strain H]OTN66188.1 Uncharacterized protein PKNOH_S09511000 [Plasmodium knowlesi]CAA9986283.1 eukaryotic translation initiation factor 4E, putative [Plasmodium knowlesi strain H]SBO25502.1 conserved Plasmodium protein, unknown function [Plasmodium knowlesi strain H]SBO28269.1 conserved Plasmodium protein, unknown function [Plasmodium knowlesi strain H]VVS75757.1 eukaryotic translation initiation factor 4E, putative [|eukprot:XP_002257689.1 hypothetical protein, conserved in Plasmodium species [Plasmodium knowlesi strain H]
MKEILECVNNVELAEIEKEKKLKQKEKKKEKQKDKEKENQNQKQKQKDKQKEGKAKNDDLYPNDENGAPKKCEPVKNSKPGNKGTNLKNKKNAHKESRTNNGDEDDEDDDNEGRSGNNNDSNKDSNEIGRCKLIEKSNTFTIVGKGKREPKSRCDDGKESKGSSTCGGATPSGTISRTGSGTGSGTGSAIGIVKGVQKANGHTQKAGKKKKEMNKENQKANAKTNAPEKKNGTTNVTNSNELGKDKMNSHKKGTKEANGNENGIRSNSVAEGKITISTATHGENNGKKKNGTEQKNKANPKKGAKKNKQKNENYLQNTWVFLFDKENRKYYEQYVNGLVFLETFNTIEKFYKNYKYMKSPSSIKEYYNIYLFKHNYKPIYEEYSNGFICIIKNENCFRDNVADLIWEKMVLLAIGEEFNLVDLSGIQLCIRENEIFFKIWMKNYSNYIKSILMKRVSELLDLPPNTSIITKILSNVYYNRKNGNLKDKNEKGKKMYNKNNKPVEYPGARKDFFKLKNYGTMLVPPNYGIGNYNFYKNNLDMNLYYLYNQQVIPNHPYLYYPLNMYNQHYSNGYPDFMYDYNMGGYPMEGFNNNSMENEMHAENNFSSNQLNGIANVEKKKKFDYVTKSKDYRKHFVYPKNTNENFEDIKSSTCI